MQPSATNSSASALASSWLALRSIFFTIVMPGTVVVYIPLRLLHGHEVPHSTLRFIGLVPLAAGAALLLWCIVDFARIGRGTLAIFDAPRHLVIRGPYAYVRNPMYVGVGTMLVGEALLFGSAAIALYALVVFSFVSLFVILYEEPHLNRQFGAEYAAYCREVHRWLPRFRRAQA